MIRKEKITTKEIYHICNKSIANFGIFKDPQNARRFLQVLHYYNTKARLMRFSYMYRGKPYESFNLIYPVKDVLVKFISYVIMPDHYHILIKIVRNRLSKFMNDVENSFTRYFNIKFKRKGPLWQSPFRAVRIKTDEQLIHVTRYIHLNPTTDNLVEKPEDWKFSSYKDFITDERILKEFINEISIKNPRSYKKFVEDQKDYQRKLKKIKKLLLE